ncbi:TIGR02301 family protein [Pararhizobium sp.]|uniref:TIGR02301 family protein n=1 Tax=Pararhizobium sp. TaxID=1977563 RepID=UPI0027213F07|nr:TIGR02301 family protein [Pararhizobium sp.]MDO9417522.1 TIGR02301 family protein [Pararhizobium sp.]
MSAVRLAFVVVFCAGALAHSLAHAQPAKTAGDKKSAETVPAVAVEEKPVPYDERLLRLAEVMGSVHYLRNLCQKTGEDQWRVSMQTLLDAETKTEPKRKERLTAGFNRGFRAFASVYTSCTGSAVVAEERYRAEGATLVSEIVARFGN